MGHWAKATAIGVALATSTRSMFTRLDAGYHEARRTLDTPVAFNRCVHAQKVHNLQHMPSSARHLFSDRHSRRAEFKHVQRLDNKTTIMPVKVLRVKLGLIVLQGDQCVELVQAFPDATTTQSARQRLRSRNSHLQYFSPTGDIASVASATIPIQPAK